MKLEKLLFGHKDLLSRRLKQIDTGIAEYTFPNLYLYRNTHDYEVFFDEQVFIKGRTYDGYTYFMPTVKTEERDLDYLKHLMRHVDFLFPIPESWLMVFHDDVFEFASKADDTDYLYLTEKMGTYKGRKLHKKRNLLRQFERSYEHEARPLANNLLRDALFILDEWQAHSEQNRDDTDYVPCREAIELYEELALCGGIYYAENEPAGFIIGEELNEETFVLHFAKGRTEFKGIYQYMFNNFSRVLPEKYRYLNLEQDLGSPSLRVAKSSYMPDAMIKKVRVSLRK